MDAGLFTGATVESKTERAAQARSIDWPLITK
jgi:hypothetical protein